MRRATLLALMILAGSGAQPASATTPFTARNVKATTSQTSWSPDGRWIASLQEDPEHCCQSPEVMLLAPDDSRQRILGHSTYAAVWSQDGRRIAWLDYRNGNRLTVADVDSGAVSPTDLAVKYDYWDWSPDGERFAYVAPSGSLRIAARDGSSVRELAPSAAYPQWSPDGLEIAFSQGWSSCSGPPSPVELIGADGTNHRVLWGPGEVRAQPAWSPLGDRIAFGAGIGCRIYPSRVYVAQRDGTGERVVHEISTWDIAGATLWSPSGSWVAASLFNGVFTLIEVDGPRFVPPHGGLASWAPTGDKVVYSEAGFVKVLSVDGSEHSIAAGHGADWAPDGARISYIGQAYETSTSFGHCQEQVFVINPDGTGKRPVSPCWQNGYAWPQVRDVIYGTQAADTVRAYAGPDVVHGFGGDDTIYGGDGRDRLFGGPGSDVIYGGSGSDRIYVQDGEPDHVSCGPGMDLVFADAQDVVASDCELVRRA